MTPGTIVRCRNRDWVLLPGDEKVYRLQPLAGASDDVVEVNRELTNLIGYDLPEERVRSSRFPMPSEQDVSDAASAHLLWQAARLTLREGATPFRSLGRISIRPRVYQFVPLLMALRLDPVRLFIADDVGVGKTIEVPLGDIRGKLFGISLFQLQLVWLLFASGTWAVAIVFYRLVCR